MGASFIVCFFLCMGFEKNVVVSLDILKVCEANYCKCLLICFLRVPDFITVQNWLKCTFTTICLCIGNL